MPENARTGLAHLETDFLHEGNVRVRPILRSIPCSVQGLAKFATIAWLGTFRGEFHVHISDCDGTVHGDLPPGRGVCDFVPYLEAIKALDFDGTISIELEYSPEPDKIVEWVEEAYKETNALMQQVGLRG